MQLLGSSYETLRFAAVCCAVPEAVPACRATVGAAAGCCGPRTPIAGCCAARCSALLSLADLAFICSGRRVCALAPQAVAAACLPPALINMKCSHDAVRSWGDWSDTRERGRTNAPTDTCTCWRARHQHVASAQMQFTHTELASTTARVSRWFMRKIHERAPQNCGAPCRSQAHGLLHSAAQ